MAEPLVRIEHVSKQFVLHKDKSLKDRVLYWAIAIEVRARSFWALDDVTSRSASARPSASSATTARARARC